MSFTLVTVTATYLEPDNVTPLVGTVSFQLAQDITDGAGGRILASRRKVGTLNGSGVLSVSLAATDDPTTAPQNAVYLVTESFVGVPTNTYFIEVPSTSPTLNLALAAHVSLPSPYQAMLEAAIAGSELAAEEFLQDALDAFDTGVLSVNGETGVVDLSGTYVENPFAADKEQFVSPRGNDANDGLSAKKAKLTITAALAAIGANPGIIRLGQGIVLDSVASWPPNIALDGIGPGISVVKSPNGANAPVIKGKDYDTLTGKVYAVGDATRGAYNVCISNVTIDGNKANNTSGEGIAIWGNRLNFENVVVQNCAGDGIRTEFTTHDGISGADDPIESSYVNVKTVLNGGDGWRYRGPHDAQLSHYVTMGNGGLGWRNASVAGSYQGGIRGMHWNSWANATGSFYLGSSVALFGADATGSNVGVGVDMAPGIGSCKLIGVTIAGHTTGIIVRGSGHIISIVGGPNPGTLVQIGSGSGGPNGGGLSVIEIVGAGALSGDLVSNVNVVNPNVIKGRWSGAIGGSLYTAGGSAADSVDLWSSGLGSVVVAPGPGVKSNYTGYTPKWPVSDGTMVCCNSVSTSGTPAAGANGALPATVKGYMRQQLPDGTDGWVAYY